MPNEEVVPAAPKAPKSAVATPAPLKDQVKELLTQTQEAQIELGAALGDADAKEARENMGLDLDFDVASLVEDGVIAKRGVPIVPKKMYVDMHSPLLKSEAIAASRLVEEAFPSKDIGMILSETGIERKTAAVLAMAITRVNKSKFPTPEDGKEDGKAWDDKKALFLRMFQMPNPVVDRLWILYTNMPVAEELFTEETIKKS